MVRRLSVLTVLWVVLMSLLSTGIAVAQDGDDEESPAEPVYYGDTELIDALRTYGLLDEWIAASPVAPQASLLLVTGGGSYQAQRQEFLNSLEVWAGRTESVRDELTRLDAAQGNADRLRALVTQVREALVLDDRLRPDSTTLAEIEDALAQLADMQIPEHPPEEAAQSQAPLILAEVQLKNLRALAETELVALNGAAPAITSSGTEAFIGYEDLQTGLDEVDQLVTRGRELVRPAREESERLVSSALAQIPNLHAARMVAPTDVDGLSVVTVDAYIRAARGVPCSVDWALLAGIGRIESNHGRLGGASVSRFGQVSTAILGPLLDGGASEREAEASPQEDALSRAAEARRAADAALRNSSWRWLLTFADATDLANADEDQGNGFAVVIDTDNGRLDGNEQWDRAVGPMQFIPETWSKWATDGNGDGVADPHNLYDAAASAARFLCDLSATRGPSPSTYVLGYNSSRSYVRDVLAAANALRAISLPDF